MGPFQTVEQSLLIFMQLHFNIIICKASELSDRKGEGSVILGIVDIKTLFKTVIKSPNKCQKSVSSSLHV